MPASAELVELCQTHLDLLRRTFGEVSSVIYLTLGMDQDSEPMLVPVARVPESSDLKEFFDPINQPGALPPADLNAIPSGQLASIENPNPETGLERLVLPLIHQEIVMGVLVILRPDRAWETSEQQYLQTLSTSLAAGCFLDRQNQWLRQRLNTKQALQGKQSEVFHNLLHQFRNPLTAIGTFGKLMLRRLSPDDPNYRLADGIVRESQHLKELVIDFDAAVDIGDTDIAQEVNPPLLLESNKAAQQLLLPALGRSLTSRPQLLSDVLYPLITVTVAAASERNRSFWHSPLDQFAGQLVTIDAQALQEVLANLLDNAFKYTPHQAWVWLLVGLRKDNYVGLVIGDSGPGIPEEDQAHLFERHYRGVQAEGTVFGTGLGLAIAQDLVTQMGGTIEVISPIWSQAPPLPWLPTCLHQSLSSTDNGTVFIVWLPVMNAQS